MKTIKKRIVQQFEIIIDSLSVIEVHKKVNFLFCCWKKEALSSPIVNISFMNWLSIDNLIRRATIYFFFVVSFSFSQLYYKPSLKYSSFLFRNKSMTRFMNSRFIDSSSKQWMVIFFGLFSSQAREERKKLRNSWFPPFFTQLHQF